MKIVVASRSRESLTKKKNENNRVLGRMKKVRCQTERQHTAERERKRAEKNGGRCGEN